MYRNLSALLTVLSTSALAQCPFTPTISPSAPVLCPGEQATLITQEYASYQWYRDGQLIPGANGQSLSVNSFDDAGYSYSVLAEEDGCFEMSAQVLVDGWVFLPPFVIHEGDDPIAIGPFGEPTYCEGAFVQLTLGMPYTENITWTNNGVPITGATQPSLVVTTAGSYSASAAPAICPNSITQLGVSIDIAFQAPTQPVINAVDETLCATPAGEFYQWYFNGTAMIGTDQQCITATEPGSYTVLVDYDHDCQVISEPYLSTSVGEQVGQRPWSLFPNPSSGMVTVIWSGPLTMGTYWSVYDAQGREVRNGFMPANGSLQLDLSDLPKGTYHFQAAEHAKAMGPATRFTLVR